MSNEEKILELLENLTSKVSGIDERISGMDERISELQETVTRVAVTQENVVLPQLSLLAEGHKTLLETLVPKERMEVLEDEVITLKTAVKVMSKRIAALEKAQ